MKAIFVFFCTLFAVLLLGYGLVVAHSGGLDSKGGHYNRKTGEYHYHRGSNAPSKSKATSKEKVKSESKSKSSKAAGAKKKK